MTAVLLGTVTLGGGTNPQNRPAAQAGHSLKIFQKTRGKKQKKELSHGYQPKDDMFFPSKTST